jgi:hypothetical protein
LKQEGKEIVERIRYNGVRRKEKKGRSRIKE